jgi:hypothetical protein
MREFIGLGAKWLGAKIASSGSKAILGTLLGLVKLIFRA